MNVQRCLEILREVKDVAFATVDEKGLPQIRIIDVMLVENEKLYFCTSKRKRFLQPDYQKQSGCHYWNESKFSNDPVRR